MTRFLLAAVVVVLAAGCGDPRQGEEPEELFSVEALQTKLRVLQADDCHAHPRDVQPQACEKYITQVANAASTVDQGARSGHEQLGEPAERMSSAVAAYRDGNCAHSESDDTCTAALADLSAAISDADAAAREAG